MYCILIVMVQGWQNLWYLANAQKWDTGFPDGILELSILALLKNI